MVGEKFIVSVLCDFCANKFLPIKSLNTTILVQSIDTVNLSNSGKEKITRIKKQNKLINSTSQQTYKNPSIYNNSFESNSKQDQHQSTL